MPIFKRGEMFKASGFIIVTTSSFLTMEEKLFMGRGAAYELKKRLPGIDLIFGRMILQKCGHLGRYGLLFHKKYGIAQVKYSFSEKARFNLMRLSMEQLAKVAKEHKETIHNINFPGIGNGGLEKAEVEPLLQVLPENVWVWEKNNP